MLFPYGIADFHKIRDGGYFYMDRTDRIPLIENSGSQLVFMRPRRFGKSLWLSTLENYYDLARAADFEQLFGGLKIGQNPTPLHNRYFILKLNFSMVNPEGDHVAIRQTLFDHLNIEIENLVARYGPWLQQPVRIQRDNAVTSLQSLLGAISQTTCKLYLLIDEYDNFANEVMISPLHGANRYEELVRGEGTIKTFFKAVKDGAERGQIDRIFLTGVSPVVLSDITSGYNVTSDISVDPDYHDLFGFNADELRAVLGTVAVVQGFDAGLEQGYFKVFDNRDLRWSNELVVKTAFLVTLFNDAFYIMDSEPALEQRYGDLLLRVRPDMRQYALLDHFLELNALSLKAVGLSSVELMKKTREELREWPGVKELLQEAQQQLAAYREILERQAVVRGHCRLMP